MPASFWFAFNPRGHVTPATPERDNPRAAAALFAPLLTDNYVCGRRFLSGLRNNERSDNAGGPWTTPRGG